MLRHAFTIAVAATAVAFAGGFHLTVGNPAANSDPQAKDAAAIFRIDGCPNKSEVGFSATAEGLYEGKRKTVQLKLTPLSTPGAFAVKKQWPDAGVWVVAVTARYMGSETGALIPMSRDGFNREAVKTFRGAPPSEEIQAALTSLDAEESRTARR